MVDQWKAWTRDSPKWVLINWPKIPQMLQNLSAQIVYPSPKVWDFDEKKASLGVRVCVYTQCAHSSWHRIEASRYYTTAKLLSSWYISSPKGLFCFASYIIP